MNEGHRGDCRDALLVKAVGGYSTDRDNVCRDFVEKSGKLGEIFARETGENRTFIIFGNAANPLLKV